VNAQLNMLVSSAPALAYLFLIVLSRKALVLPQSSHVSFSDSFTLPVPSFYTDIWITESTRRSALQPFSLTDGTHVDVGDWFCTPVRAIMTNSADFPNALKFSGFRFADPVLVRAIAENEGGAFEVLQAKPTKLTDVDMTYHVWGTGRMAW
jgi:hypothetical protein